MYNTITFKLQNHFAIIALNRPDKYNAFNQEMATELQSAIRHCEANLELNCVILTGNGKAFSSGQDISEIIDDPDKKIEDILETYYTPIVTLIRESRLPFIAMVNGVAAGAGANIALCCDLVFAAHSASFVQAFSKIGLVPDSGGTWILPRLIGYHKAFELMALGEKFTSSDAFQIGMINKLVQDDFLMEYTISMAEKISSMPAKAIEFTKKALNQSYYNDFQSQLVTEKIYQSKAGNTHDYKEGIQSFVEKRQPKFIGK